MRSTFFENLNALDRELFGLQNNRILKNPTKNLKVISLETLTLA
jgi:hypothetical protein